MVLSVPLVARIDAGMALSLGVLRPMPPIFVLMFMRSREWIGMESLFVMDSIMCVLILSNDLAVVLSHVSQVSLMHVDV